MQYEENKQLAPFSSLNLGGQARMFHRLEKPADLPNVYRRADQYNLPVTILGGGTNTFFADGLLERLVVKNAIGGKRLKKDGGDVLLSAGAGLNWDKIVGWSVERGLSGLEALSGIPGTVGAAPVQNIGAYGAELSDVLETLTVWDRDTARFRTLERGECEFGYRSSRFKSEQNRFVVTRVTLRLSADMPQKPTYKTLTKELAEREITEPTVRDIWEAVLAVRGRRLPDIKTQPNAGSFFVNPVVKKVVAQRIAQSFADMPSYDVDENHRKIPAGWLIEKAGLRGETLGNFKTSADNALVLIHHGSGTTAELREVARHIKSTVKDQFGITLEREPNLVK